MLLFDVSASFLKVVVLSAIQAQSAGRPETDVYVLAIVDFNVPGAKASERISELSQCIQFLNDLAPQRHACLLEMAEHAKKSSKRGISDEEREVEESLWGLRQHLDNRWMMPFALHPSAEQQSNRRQVRNGNLLIKFVECIWFRNPIFVPIIIAYGVQVVCVLEA